MNKILFSFSIIALSISGAFAQIADKAENISPLLISEQVPNVEITSLQGEQKFLTDIVSKKRSILLFYRGGWCPYCNAHLSEVGLVENEILELGYQVLAVSPDSPENLMKTAEKTDVKYTLYSDGNGSLMQAMGIAFQAPERYFNRLSNVSDSQNPGLLPVPSLFVIDTDGTIVFEFISPNYKQRIGADLLLEILKQLNANSE